MKSEGLSLCGTLEELGTCHPCAHKIVAHCVGKVPAVFDAAEDKRGS